MAKKIVHNFDGDMEKKICSRCKENKPVSDYFASKRSTDGLQSCCKACGLEQKRTYYPRYTDKNRQRASEWYTENRDKVRLQRLEERQKNGDAIRAAERERAKNRNKELRSAYQKEYREIHKEELREKAKAKRQSPEYKELKRLSQSRLWNTEKAKATRQMGLARYRSRKAEVSSTLTKLQWQLCKQFFSHTCAYCGKPLKNLTQDHFVPLSGGGGYDVDNIIPCCKSCNSSKQDKNFSLWYSQQPFFDEQRKNRILEYLALF